MDGSKSNHEWNIVTLDGVPRLVDSCWGAGHVKGQAFEKDFTPHHFCTRIWAGHLVCFFVFCFFAKIIFCFVLLIYLIVYNCICK